MVRHASFQSHLYPTTNTHQLCKFTQVESCSGWLDFPVPALLGKPDHFGPCVCVSLVQLFDQAGSDDAALSAAIDPIQANLMLNYNL
jgi:hypothetical protein